MSLYSKSQKQEHLQVVRLLMIRNPNLTLRQMQNILIGERDLQLTLPYLMKIKQKIHKERSRRMENQDAKNELGKYEDLVNLLEKDLWGIILSNSSTKNEKTGAIQTLVKINDGLFRSKVDACIFNVSQKADSPN